MPGKVDSVEFGLVPTGPGGAVSAGRHQPERGCEAGLWGGDACEAARKIGSVDHRGGYPR